MFNSLFRRSAAFLVFISLFPFSASALEFSASGYFRNRNHLQHNLALDRDQKPQNRVYGDLRFRLDPTFHIADWAEIKSSFDVIDGVYGGNPRLAGSYTNPAQAQDPFFTDSQSALGRPAANGDVAIVNGLVQTTDRSLLLVRRVWAEIITPYTLIKVGRQPAHWGLGIVQNSGQDINSDFGTTLDRLTFETRMGSYLVSPGYSKKVENSWSAPHDDFSEWFLYFGRYVGENDNGFFGFYISSSSQERQPSPSDYEREGTDIWLIDFYAKYPNPIVNFQLEAAIFSGKIAGRDLLALNSALRLDKSYKDFLFQFETGYSSGTSNGARARNKMYTVLFNPDYKVARLLFNEALPLQPTNQITAANAGAVGNAVYFKGQAGWNPYVWLGLTANLISAFATESPLLSGNASSGGRYYGFEYDLTADFKIKKQLSLGTTFAHFIPGTVYQSVSKAESAVSADFFLNLTF